jgi:hypothetical protein
MKKDKSRTRRLLLTKISRLHELVIATVKPAAFRQSHKPAFAGNATILTEST